MSLKCCLFLIFLVWNGSAIAQHSIEGRVFELNTRIPLQEVKIENLRTGKFVFTDSTGRFRIPAIKEDILTAQAFSYLSDTLLLIDLEFLEIFLQPKINQLEEVRVKPQAVNLGNLRDPDYRGQSVIYQTDESGNKKGGIVIRLWYWNKDSKKERRAKRRLKNEEVLKEIDRLFSPLNIARYVPLKGEELNDFIGLYRPMIKEYRSPGFNLALYLNDCYKEFKTLPPGKQKLPPLVPQ